MLNTTEARRVDERTATREGVPMGGPDTLPKRPHRKLVAGLAVGLPLLVVLLGVAVTTIPWFRNQEADASMPAKTPPIDGRRAYDYLKKICEIGPRPAGSAANAKQRELVAAHFKKFGAAVREQPFQGEDPKTHARVDMVNLIGAWFPDRKDRVVIGVHYDTRPFPDEEPDPAKRDQPFIGANDGASGVALLMEMAHHMEKLPTQWGVDFVLFDGEELVYGPGQNFIGDFFLGSKEFARVYASDVDARRIPYRYRAGLVLDMIGDKNLAIDQEEYSLNLAHDLVAEIWAVARKLKATAFRSRVGQAVRDDHLPLNNGGIPTIDLIDFDYPHWHTTGDTPDKCSAASLEQVGRVVTTWLAQPRKRAR